MNRIKLNECASGTPGIHIPKWRSTLRNGHVSHIHGTAATYIHDTTNTITKCRQNQDISMCIYFGTINQHAMHPILGVPQLI